MSMPSGVGLEELGDTVVTPLKGLGIGQQQHRLSKMLSTKALLLAAAGIVGTTSITSGGADNEQQIGSGSS